MSNGSQNPERDAEMVRRYAAGQETLAQIGASYGITRERVRQVVRRSGLSPEESWAAKRIAQVGRHTQPCVRCGTAFYAPKKRNMFCSRRCADAARSAALRVPDAELLEALRELAGVLGRTPNQYDMNTVGAFSHTTYVLRFGGVAAAQRAAGLVPNGRGGAGHRYRAC